MITEFRLRPHRRIEGASVIEVWYDGKRIGAIYGSDGPGISVMSQYPMTVETSIMTVEVSIATDQEPMV